MGDREQALVGFVMMAALIALGLGAFVYSQYGVGGEIAGFGVLGCIGILIYAGWRDEQAKSKDTRRQQEARGAVEITQTEARLTVVAERFVLPVVCAKTDRGFAVVFERRDPREKFRIAAIGALGGDAGGAIQARTVPSAQLDQTGWACPFCADRRGYVRCGSCQQAVCKGRVTTLAVGDVFACRDSCRAGGVITHRLTEIAGADGGRDAVLTVRRRGMILRQGS
jgi:hypothetical protein